MKIGITGSISSGKTTATRILSFKRGPVFSADKVVKNLYKNESFKKLLSKKFRIKNNKQIKKTLKKIILSSASNFKKLERIIHPLVRKKMRFFSNQNRYRKYLFYEIPLLIESKLTRYFDVIIFIKANKNLRLKRFKANGGNVEIFNLLNDRQIKDNKKAKFSNFVVVNEKNILVLKKKLSSIMEKL